MRAPDWLTATPVAHRGLHDSVRNVIENTAGAVAAAMDRGFAVEVDLQETADGVPVVFHDDTLERLTNGSGPIHGASLAELRRLTYRQTSDRIQTLEDLLDQVGDRVALLIEIKSDFTGKPAFAARVAERVAGYRGRAALMSFDPGVVAAVRRAAPGVPRGITAERYRGWKPDGVSPFRRAALRHLLHAVRSAPQFVAYSVDDLPAAAPTALRRSLGAPILAWTVRSQEQRRHAEAHADQMIFEGFVP